MSQDKRTKNATERRRARHSATAGIKRAPREEGVCSTAAVLDAALRLWEARNGHAAARSVWARKPESSS